LAHSPEKKQVGTAVEPGSIEQMSRAQFQIAFEGEPFDDGEIDVRDLAPTLLAFGELIQAANKALNGERAEAKLRVATTSHGSFQALLSVDVGWLTDMLDAVHASSDRVVAANLLLELLIKAGTAAGMLWGVIAVAKKLKGKRPEKVQSKGDGTTEITINGDVLVVDDRTILLLEDVPTREALQSIGDKAGRIKGMKAFRIGEDSAAEEALRLAPADLSSLNIPPEPDEPETEITHREAWLKLVSVHFSDGYKWRFTDGGERPFTAEMEDTDFANKVQDGSVTMSANDALRCRLREEQSISSSNLTKAIYVEEVLDHRPGAKQLKLL
jgi:hypothetical protein